LKLRRSPTASRRPATTGLDAPGSHTQTYASVGSEIILDPFRRDAYALWKDRDTAAGAIEIQRESRRILVEQWHPHQRGHLKSDPKAHRRIASFHLAQRRLGDPGSLGQLTGRPAPLSTRESDLGTQKLRGFDRFAGVEAVSLDIVIIAVKSLNGTITSP
jgi:hypothetical protein